jgi:hypothetical protein
MICTLLAIHRRIDQQNTTWIKNTPAAQATLLLSLEVILYVFKSSHGFCIDQSDIFLSLLNRNIPHYFGTQSCLCFARRRQYCKYEKLFYILSRDSTPIGQQYFLNTTYAGTQKTLPKMAFLSSTLQRNFDLCVPRKGTALPWSQFPH